MTMLSVALVAAAASSGPVPAEHGVMLLVGQVALRLLVGRLLGEAMQRIGQPGVVGQLLAGILIGPSVLGVLWPGGFQALFPPGAEQQRMLDALSQFGVLLLLLLTGMETDLSIVSRMRRTAVFSATAGIVVPFACGLVAARYLLPTLLPADRPLVSALFVATCLSVSSVKIVAMIVMEVDFTRRNIGQMILATAILDDTIGWIIVGLIAGFAARGSVDVTALGLTLGGTAVFLALAFTVGRPAVAYLIRWTNDNLLMEVPVVTAILIVMCAMALVTALIGVSTALGAFVAGILIGSSPILTRHIQEQLRGVIIALFTPVFFVVAGLSIDLTIFRHLSLLELAAVLVGVASFGKLVGGYVGGRLGRLTSGEATALAIGMNARGSTQVIVASIGLSLGVLSRDLFTLVMIVAIVTTIATPPLLKWALLRIPPTGEEKARLEREAAEAKEFVPQIERLLIVSDDSDDGKLASLLAGLLVGTRRIMTTVATVRPEGSGGGKPDREAVELVKRSAEQGTKSAGSKEEEPTVLTIQAPAEDASAAVLREAEKGYDMVVLGIREAFGSSGHGHADPLVARVVREFHGVTAIAVGRGTAMGPGHPIDILVPTIGTDYSRTAAEVAVAIAKASRGRVTALNITPVPRGVGTLRLRRRLRTASRDAGRGGVRQVTALGQREGVNVHAVVRLSREGETVVADEACNGHDLIVLGVKQRAGEPLSFGDTAEALLEESPCPLLLVSS